MKTKRRGFFAVVGGGIAAAFGFKPVIAQGVGQHVAKCVGFVPIPDIQHTYNKEVMRAIICKRMPNGALKGKAYTGLHSDEFYEKVRRCENDGVGETYDKGAFIYPVPDAYVSEDGDGNIMEFCDGEYVTLTENKNHEG